MADVPLIKWDGEAAKESPNRAIVTSHGCVCEDFERWMEAGKSSAADRVLIQVAPLRPAKDFKHKVDEIAQDRDRPIHKVDKPRVGRTDEAPQNAQHEDCTDGIA